MDEKAIEAAAEVYWNDFFGARSGGPLADQPADGVARVQTLATTKAAIEAYLSALPPLRALSDALSRTAGQECQSTEHRIDEILRIASQDMTAAFGDGGEQYRREALAAILATVGNAAACYERQRRTAGQEWRREEEIAALRELYEWYDRDGSVGAAADVFEKHRALLAQRSDLSQ